MKKIKWGNIGYLTIMISCINLVIHDVYKLAIEPMFTGYLSGLTWFGVITFSLCMYIASEIYDKLFN